MFNCNILLLEIMNVIKNIMKQSEVHTLILKLIAEEKASFRKRGKLIEFCFKGLRYPVNNFDFETVAHTIGTDNLTKELDIINQ